MQTLLTRISEEVAHNADLVALANNYTTARANYLDNLQYVTQAVARHTDIATLLSRLTQNRSGYLDVLNGKMLPKVELFTARGTWTRPSNVHMVWLTVVGGGGGGGGGGTKDSYSNSGDLANGAGGGGGGGGAQTIKIDIPFEVGGNQTIIVGTGGNGGAGGGHNQNGRNGDGGGISRVGDLRSAGRGWR